MALSTTNLTAKQREQVLNYIAATAASKTMTAQQLLECSADQKQALIKAGLITAEEAETGTTIALNNEKIKEILLDETLTVEDKKLILGAFGVTGANLTEASSWEVLAKSIGKATVKMLAWLFTTPAGWATLAISAIVGATIAYNKWGDTLENTREKLVDLKSECDSISSDLESANGELKTTQDRISELEGKGKLSFTEAEELENLRKQNNELQRTVDLLELEHKAKTREKNKAFVSTMEKDTGDPFEYEVNPDGKNAGQYGIDDNYLTSETKYIEYQFEQRSKLLNDLSNAKTKEDKERIQKSIDEIDEFLREQNEEYIEDSDGIDYIQNPTTEDDKKVNEWLDYINDFQDKMAIAMGGDNAKTNAFNRVVDNWKFDELLNPLQELGKEGKVTAEMLNDPKYDAFIQKLIDIGFISDDTEGSLRFVANAFNGTATSAKDFVEALDDKGAIDNFIENIDNEAKALGVTKDQLIGLIGNHIVFNNTKLSLDDKIEAIKKLGLMAGWTKGKIDEVIILMNRASGNFPDSMTQGEKDARRTSAEFALKDLFGGWSYVDTDTPNNTSPYTPSDNPTGSGDSTTNEALDNYLRYAENLYKVHQDEAKYINDLQWAYNNLTKDEDERLKVTEKINEAYRDMADNRIKDLEHQIEMTKNLKGENADVIAQLNEIQRVSHEEANRLRSMGYDDNSNEIQELQKTWWDAENSKLDFYSKQHENIIRDIEHARDMVLETNPYANTSSYYKQLQEEYHKEAERLRALDPEKYKEYIQKLQVAWWDAQNEIYDIRKEAFEKYTDFGSSYFDSHKTLLQSYYDVTNAVRDAQHEINKELETSKTMYEYLDEDTRKLLFNQEDYNTLSKELLNIQSEADKLQREYQSRLETATLDTIEEITSNYEMQYETLMKSYEIAKADLEIAKKKAQLNNVLNERNVRMFIDGQWQWVSNTQDVINAKSELADAEYAKQTAKAGLRQTESINNLTAQQDQLGTIINKFESGVINLDTAVGKVVDMFNVLPIVMEESLERMNPKASVSYKTTNGTATIPGVGKVGVSFIDGKTTNDLPVGTVVHTNGGNYKITGGTPGNYTSELVVEDEYATGTRYTSGGIALMGENEPEMHITSHGKLIPINQPTLGNVAAGGIVFNQLQMSNLRDWWDLSNLTTPSVGYINNIPAQSESFVFSGDIIIHNPADAKDVADNVVNHIVQGLKLQRKSR